MRLFTWQFSRFRSVALIPVCLGLSFLGGCMTLKETEPAPLQPSAAQQPMILSVGKQSSDERVKLLKDATGNWIPLQPVVKALGLKMEWADDRKSLQIGQTDVLYQIHLNDARAESMGSPIRLPQAPKTVGKQVYLTKESLEALFGTTLRLDGNRNVLTMDPVNDRNSGIRQTDLSNGPSGMRLMSALGASPLPSTTASPVNRPAVLIAKANELIGTPYRFGSKPYPESGTFDCSSFVQYLYANAGVSLPRSSRIQAQVGKEVSTTQLRKGDLLFFYTPGRFSSNKIVGHVGMYLGNGTFVHTYGKPGVIKNKIDDPKWSYRLLFAKRVP